MVDWSPRFLRCGRYAQKETKCRYDDDAELDMRSRDYILTAFYRLELVLRTSNPKFTDLYIQRPHRKTQQGVCLLCSSKCMHGNVP